ncbi:hypothetical protein PC129_g16888 [Phytophthora cactorum]|uniref:Uncharacterized protein n=2 Tax=Phytophthora cactorum TaxID=29920 RepID=A0A8T1FAU8_9STRA|nr:hypothetical protein PC112_g16568 [Phytophthora cactorum]KAG2850646.1 hypothetical protein PC113_g16602 [Phytophthora cactorum]KAG2888927.1 hypothetical protein PC114_g18176 [Phytophthora cactorum]KAG2900996.1 hypothetical protein PC115_g16012 [Phytophthora cactorum]KAG2908889.1 hypothetical protein PC117_g19833 [Phytophthora cactorum]
MTLLDAMYPQRAIVKDATTATAGGKERKNGTWSMFGDWFSPEKHLKDTTSSRDDDSK